MPSANAPIHAAMRADAMLDKGDLGGYAAWRRILRAVGELQGMTPKPGAAGHGIALRCDLERLAPARWLARRCAENV